MSADLRPFVRDIPDFPKPGILFRDLTPLMAHGPALRSAIVQLSERVKVRKAEVVVGIEARGFIFGAAVAAALGLGFVPIRKPGKLPWRTRRAHYDLEYGSDGIEMHEDGIVQGARAIVIDDVLATGGTAAAAVRLCRESGAQVVGTLFVIEISALEGRKRLPDVEIDTLIAY